MNWDELVDPKHISLLKKLSLETLAATVKNINVNEDRSSLQLYTLYVSIVNNHPDAIVPGDEYRIKSLYNEMNELDKGNRMLVYSLLEKAINSLLHEDDVVEYEPSEEPRRPKMRILVACEESQEVTRRFREKGHEAYSCDILDTSGDNPEWHMKQDVVPLLKQKWDMIIAFPPCTELSGAGAPNFAAKRAEEIRLGLPNRQQEAIDFFMLFANADCPKICIENPVGVMSTVWRKPDQYVHPWMFGDEASKKTGFWLKGLPKLKPTNIVGQGEFVEWTNKKTGKKKRMAKWLADGFWKDGVKLPAEQRRILRSKTFPGIAQAMADQWG